MNQGKAGIKICTWNSRGVMGKFHELELFLRIHDVDVLLLTETKLNSSNNFFIPDYKFTRADHPDLNRRKGGLRYTSNQNYRTTSSPYMPSELPDC